MRLLLVSSGDRLHELGVSQRTVHLERDLWILAQSASPKDAASWIPVKREALDDPEFRALYLTYDTAFDWSPDDPRLEALADRTSRWVTTQHGRSTDAKRSDQDRTIAQLVATSVGASSPAWE